MVAAAGITAALTAAPIVLDLAATYAPGLVRFIAGDKAGDVAQSVANIVKAVTGSSTLEDAAAALKQDAAAAAQVRIRLAELENERLIAERNADRDELLAQLADVQNARQQTVDLARAGSPIAWGAPLVSLLVIVTFGGVLYLMLGKPIALSEAQGTVVNILVGTLATAFGAVINYWMGSSAGSMAKDHTLSTLMQTTAAKASPPAPPIAPKPADPTGLNRRMAGNRS